MYTFTKPNETLIYTFKSKKQYYALLFVKVMCVSPTIKIMDNFF